MRQKTNDNGIALIYVLPYVIIYITSILLYKSIYFCFLISNKNNYIVFH